MDYSDFSAALVLGLAIGAIIGVIIGVIIDRLRLRRRVVGRLRIDHSEPDEPARLFAELKAVTPDMIAEHKLVAFEVIDESYISRN